MTHISRQPLNSNISEEIYSALVDHITSKGSIETRVLLCTELLTKTERLMLAKRLAIINMLGEGYSFEAIQESLKVSPSTIGRLWQSIQNGKFSKTIHVLTSDKLSTKINYALEAVLNFALSKPTPRWKSLDN